MSKKEINKVSPYGSTPLQAAVHSNDPERVENILQQNGDPNITAKETGETALHRAVLNKNLEIIRMLLDFSADIDTCGLYGSALHLAVVRDIDITKELLTRKATIELRNNAGVTPMYTSAFSKRFDIVKLLSEHKAEINGLIGNNETVFHAALKKERYSVVLNLLKLGIDADPNIVNSKGDSLLHLCFKKYEIMEELLKSNASPDIQNVQGDTPLHISLRHDWKYTQLLLDYKASLGIRNVANDTPLLASACISKTRLPEMIEHLQYKLNTKSGKNFVTELLAHPLAHQENKDYILEQQSKQKAAKKRAKSSK